MRIFIADINWSRWSESAWTASARVIVVLLIIYVALRVIERLLAPALRDYDGSMLPPSETTLPRQPLLAGE